MKTVKNYLLYASILYIFCACEENESNVPQASTIRIVHAIQDIGTIDLRGFEGSIPFIGTNTIRYGSNFRFTLAVNTPTDFTITPESDTLNTVFSEIIKLEDAGEIYSLFLLGDSTRVTSLLLRDEITNYQDSIYGVRFINLSTDSEPVTVRNIALDTAGVRDTTVIASDIDFRSFTQFSQYEATSRIENHTFQYLDTEGNILASSTVPRFFFIDPPYFRNTTLALIGRSDDGEGGSNLSVAEINHF